MGAGLSKATASTNLRRFMSGPCPLLVRIYINLIAMFAFSRLND